VKIKVDGHKHKAKPFRTGFDVGATVKLVAPKRFQTKNGVRYVFKKWKGLASGKKKRKQTLAIGTTPIVVTAVYKRFSRR